MTRFYKEVENGKVVEVVAQDATGVYGSVLIRDSGEIGVGTIMTGKPMTVKLPEWDKPREVPITSKEYLDFVRRCERNSYTASVPTEIEETDETVEQVIHRILGK